MKKVLKKVFKAFFIIFVGVSTFTGIQELISAWGLREDSWFAGIGALIAIYIMIIVWKVDYKDIFPL